MAATCGLQAVLKSRECIGGLQSVLHGRAWNTTSCTKGGPQAVLHYNGWSAALCGHARQAPGCAAQQGYPGGLLAVLHGKRPWVKICAAGAQAVLQGGGWGP
ncbi:hypothetical protein NDU88_002313 [Pleurodeles waltl]|uniref:Uncharacterized protein n=1 Tax=Pleurodeles waltl TaxID=8319 RepID=A0AAV7SB94_PLEWA|nr:hypothetical protein NDU88_002313 [Pleurodeles waltl]